MAQRSCLGRVPGQASQPLLDAIALRRGLKAVANDVERVLLALGAGNHVGRRNGRGRGRRRIGRGGIGIATLGRLVLVTGGSWRRLRHRGARRQGHAGRRSQHQGQQQPATKGNEGIGLHARSVTGTRTLLDSAPMARDDRSAGEAWLAGEFVGMQQGGYT